MFKIYSSSVYLFFCLLALCAEQPGYSQNINIRGYIYKSTDSTVVKNCTVLLQTPNGNKISSTTTNNDGEFYFSLKNKNNSDQLQLNISHLNYSDKTVPLSGTDSVLRICLVYKEIKLKEVVIYSAYKPTNKGNTYTFSPREAASSISVMGEPDVIRHIASLPGVSQGIEGTLGLFVRGSNNGSNSIVFNQVPIYNYTHLLGLFSTFSPEIIKETNFYIGGIPAEYGNLSSSVTSIAVNDAADSSSKKKLTVSPFVTGGYLSIPLMKKKLCLQASGRISLVPYVANSFTSEGTAIKAEVLDFTTLLNWKVSRRTGIDIMYYTTNDYFDFSDGKTQTIQNWGAKAIKVGIINQFSPKIKLFSWAYYTSAYSLQENKNFDITGNLRSALKLGSQLNEATAQSQAEIQINNRFSSTVGIVGSVHNYFPSTAKSVTSTNVSTLQEQQFLISIFSGFAQLKYKLPNRLSISAGYRHYLQKYAHSYRNNFDLHFLADITLGKNWGIETTLDKLTQYSHVLEGLPTGWPLNITIPSYSRFPEETINQFYSGWFWKYTATDLRISLTAGGYYRDIRNIVSYKSAVSLFGMEDGTWVDEIDIGRGKSYGMESSVALNNNRFGVNIAYTLSKTTRCFPQLNNGSPFPFKFDRRHILNFQGKVTTFKSKTRKGKLREQYLNCVVAYSTGNRATLPISSYQGELPPLWNLRDGGWNTPKEFNNNAYNRQLMSGVNEFIMRDYFRTDLAYSVLTTAGKRAYEYTISVFNVLNRKNPYLYFYSENKWQQLSILGIIPSLRWTIDF